MREATTVAAPGEPELEHVGVTPWLADAVRGLRRAQPAVLDPLLALFCDPVVLGTSKTRFQCRFLRHDGNKRPSVNALATKLAYRTTEYCIPRSRIQVAYDDYVETGSPEQLTQLASEAKGLFTTLKKSGEGGELLLYLLLETYLGIPQLLCKMSLKTNTEMHVHGVDGVHGTVADDGSLALYWCESKLYESFSDAIGECMKSLAPHLHDEGGGAAQRDLLLARDNLDALDPDTTRALVRYLMSDTEESTKLEIRGACLVGFDMDDYPDVCCQPSQSLRDNLNTEVTKWQRSVQTRIGKNKLEDFIIEVFCIPFPAVEAFRKALRQRLELT